MRGTLSLPANRDPEVLERLQPVHLTNICNRMQSHLNACSSKIASEQAVITAKIKEVTDLSINSLSFSFHHTVNFLIKTSIG